MKNAMNFSHLMCLFILGSMIEFPKKMAFTKPAIVVLVLCRKRRTLYNLQVP